MVERAATACYQRQVRPPQLAASFICAATAAQRRSVVAPNLRGPIITNIERRPWRCLAARRSAGATHAPNRWANPLDLLSFREWSILTSNSGTMLVPSLPPRSATIGDRECCTLPPNREVSCHKLIFPPAHRSHPSSARVVRTVRRA
jgi:hypothetical protein